MKLFIITILALAGRAHALTPLTVATDGSGAFKTVQEAVDAAPANSLQPIVIHLNPGVYKGHVTVPANKPFLNFEGDDPETTIITDDKNVYSLDVSVTFINTELSAGVHPAGWDNWRDPSKEKTARYAEYNSTGPGADPSKRVAWARQLGREDAEAITLEAVFGMPDLTSLRKEGRWPVTDPVAGMSTNGLRIVLAGDSTVTDNGGWGRGFANRLTGDGASCINLARADRSSKSFRDEGEWDKVLAAKPDYLLIQFGHNDMPGKGPERETDPATTYHDNLQRFVEEARAAGAKPILVTSMTRRRFKDGKIHSDLFPYVDEVKKLAVEMNVPVIDLHTKSIELFEKLGPDGCRELSPIDPETGGVDGTHLNAKGGDVVGGLVAAEVVDVVPALGSHFIN